MLSLPIPFPLYWVILNHYYISDFSFTIIIWLFVYYCNLTYCLSQIWVYWLYSLCQILCKFIDFSLHVIKFFEFQGFIIKFLMSMEFQGFWWWCVDIKVYVLVFMMWIFWWWSQNFVEWISSFWIKVFVMWVVKFFDVLVFWWCKVFWWQFLM